GRRLPEPHARRAPSRQRLFQTLPRSAAAPSRATEETLGSDQEGWESAQAHAASRAPKQVLCALAPDLATTKMLARPITPPPTDAKKCLFIALAGGFGRTHPGLAKVAMPRVSMCHPAYCGPSC